MHIPAKKDNSSKSISQKVGQRCPAAEVMVVNEEEKVRLVLWLDGEFKCRSCRQKPAGERKSDGCEEPDKANLGRAGAASAFVGEER